MCVGCPRPAPQTSNPGNVSCSLAVLTPLNTITTNENTHTTTTNDRCWPDGKIVWAKEDELGGYPLCSGPAGSVAEGRKSFPSGE